jgi:hypothetical protein
VPAAAGTGRPPLLGRCAEVAALDAMLTDALAGRSQVLILRGEPGIGKSALLGRLSERLDGWRLAHAVGVESELELVHCPACESTLIYPVACSPWKRQSLVERRCPDCEHRGVVITHRLAAAVWLRRGKSAADDLHALADALADGLELEIDWPASER